MKDDLKFNPILQKESSKIQQIATNPDNSSWVFASAGSGKTKILTDRVLRLLIENVNPSKILCLTFTKVACNEMQERIYHELSNWISYDDNQIELKLEELLSKKISQENILKARRLFIEIIEGENKINIETIHSFSSSLLRLFPIEAKVPINFELIEEGQAKLLLENAKKILFNEIDNIDNFHQSLSNIFSEINEQEFFELVFDLLKHKHKIYNLHNKISIIDNFKDLLRNILSLKNYRNNQEILNEFYHKINNNSLNELILFLKNDKITNQNNALKIESFINDLSLENFDQFCSVFFSSNNTKPKKLNGKFNKIEANNYFKDFINEINFLIIDYREKLNSFKILNQTYDLMIVVEKIIKQYSLLKKKSGFLDYDDIIYITNQLVNNSEFKDWIKLKIDGNFNHILIDESQDTNIDQWNIITALTDDFFSGESKISEKRSIFIVGDEKQSIYSFQGSDPNICQKIYQFYHQKLSSKLIKIDLNNSFRSTSNILRLVDKIFSQKNYTDSICKASEYNNHCAVRSGHGKIKIWQNINHKEFDLVVKNNIKNYFQSIAYHNIADEEDLDHEDNDDLDISNSLILTELIALKIKNWIETKTLLLERDRVIKYSDIMILLRKKTGTFSSFLVQSFNRHNIPYSSTGRIKFNDDLIIQDFLSVAKFICLPDDDLNLVHLLKSPFLNFDEKKIFELCKLKNQNNTSIFKILTNDNCYNLLLEFIEFGKIFSAYNFYYKILSNQKFQESFIARFGIISITIKEKFLLKIKDIGNEDFVDLQNFLEIIEKINPDLKLDSADDNSVRITTIHSSKGLQSPIIIIPDCNDDHIKNTNRFDKIFWLNNQHLDIPLWCINKNDSNQIIDELKIKKNDLAKQEDHRLLYVALTRAEDQLYIMGSGRKKTSETWYEIIKNSLDQDSHIAIEDLMHLFQINSNIKNNNLSLQNKENYSITELYANNPNSINKRFNNSIKNHENINHYKHQIKGEIIHKILEFIGSNHYLEKQILISYASKIINDNYLINSNQKIEILNLIKNFIYSIHFDEIYCQHLKCETEIVYKKQLYRIDLIIDKPNEIIIVDYKSDDLFDQKNLEKYLNKMKIYKEAIEKIYSKKNVRCAILWIKNLKLEFIDE